VPEKIVGPHRKFLILVNISVACNDFVIYRILIVLSETLYYQFGVKKSETNGLLSL
jgi:hypothetical protein